LVGKSVDATRVAIGVLKEFNLIAVERHGRNNRYIVESATGAAPLNRGL